ncbi:MAG: MarC family protein [Lentisphaeria bacterium]|nr:MarC family protein [Lentisphaeria bacterium]
MHSFLSLWIKLFFVLTPFFALSMFLTLTEGYDEARRRRVALMSSAAVLVLCLVLFFLGRQIFFLFGITVDAFRIGAGVLLLLNGIGLVQGKTAAPGLTSDSELAVVPLGMPIIVGPATTGTLLVLGAELSSLSEKVLGSLAVSAAVASIGAVLFTGSIIQRHVGRRGLSILSKLTGLILSALAAQMIMTGVQAFLA